MASSTIAPKYGTSASNTFALRNTSAAGCEYAVAGRSLAKPYTVSILRKVGNSSATGNDHVIVSIRRTEANATTFKLSTGAVTLDISIPRDSATITADHMNEMLASLSSLLNDFAAVEDTLASHGNIITLLGGSDL